MLGLPELAGATCVAAYVARSGEPETAPLLAELGRRGVRVLLPVLLPDLDLDWAADDGPRVHSTLTPSLVEPAGARLGPARDRRGRRRRSSRPSPSTGRGCGWGTAAGATTEP